MLKNDIFKIESEDIVLRDRCIEDLDDYIFWYTVEKEWMNWDAPWEKDEPFDIDGFKIDFIKKLEKPLPAVRRRFEICLNDGKHIGWMNSYYIDSNENMLAIGIDIPQTLNRGHGIGKKAFLMFINYLLKNNPQRDIYTQTWSGNIKMMSLALKCGFREVKREVDFKEIDGRFYDDITYKLDREAFEKYSVNEIINR